MNHTKVIDPPCEYGHKRQAMECPSCSERLTGVAASAEWVKWYEQRSGHRPV